MEILEIHIQAYQTIDHLANIQIQVQHYVMARPRIF